MGDLFGHRLPRSGAQSRRKWRDQRRVNVTAASPLPQSLGELPVVVRIVDEQLVQASGYRSATPADDDTSAGSPRQIAS